MLVTLGFLTATLLALTIAPAFWSRAVRLTTQRIKERLPVTETEIRADKDRLRAEFAMTVHRLEAKIEQADLKRARHMIDLNRRDANISQLESEVSTLRSTVDEFENARRVLEHTVSERLPKVEARLDEARNLLATRDHELKHLSSSTSRQHQALEEARSINAQQGAEIERLSTSLTVRGGRNKEALNDAKFSGEVALRAEIDGLRAKTRDQAALIAKLQSTAPHDEMLAGLPALLDAARATAANGDASPAMIAMQSGDAGRAALERDFRALRSEADDRAAEIKTLTAELTALRSAESASTPDSKLALRARLTGLQTQSDQQGEMIRKLRAELAAANERLAVQGANFMEQMRRLGAGTLPASGAAAGKPARADSAPRISLAERVANSRGPQATSQMSPQPNGDGDSDDDFDRANLRAERNGHAESSAAASPTAPNATPRLIDRISSLSKA